MADSIVDAETLKKIGNIIRAKAIDLAPSFIGPLIQVDDIISVSATGQVGVVVRVNMAKAPLTPNGTREGRAARALEYGSGLHAKGVQKTYRIYPKKGATLAFFWGKVSKDTGHGAKFSGISKRTGKAILNYVDHPGVLPYHGIGYMHPALVASKTEIEQLAGENALQNLKLKIRAKFTRPGGHG